jgi:hypothetical protein
VTVDATVDVTVVMTSVTVVVIGSTDMVVIDVVDVADATVGISAIIERMIWRSSAKNAS